MLTQEGESTRRKAKASRRSTPGAPSCRPYRTRSKQHPPGRELLQTAPIHGSLSWHQVLIHTASHLSHLLTHARFCAHLLPVIQSFYLNYSSPCLPLAHLSLLTRCPIHSPSEPPAPSPPPPKRSSVVMICHSLLAKGFTSVRCLNQRFCVGNEIAC